MQLAGDPPADLDQPISRSVAGLGRSLATLRRLGIDTARQALFNLPFRYDDFSEMRRLGELVDGDKQSARVRVSSIRVEPGFGRRPQRVIAQLEDDSGSAEAIWFGRQFVERRIGPGDEIVVSGKVKLAGWRAQFSGPEFSPAGRDSLHTARVVPVYRLTGGVTQRRAREVMARVLAGALPLVVDPLRPAERVGLLPLADALQIAHFPTEPAAVADALDRLAFDELLALQLSLVRSRVAREQFRAPSLVVEADVVQELVAQLPFRLTDDQSQAISETVADLSRQVPMRRLLQGDVGSGKTAVAAVALAVAVRAGWQGAFMAPTDLLTRQHLASLEPMLSAMGVEVALVTASVPARQRRAAESAARDGGLLVVIGTHALLSESVEFAHLGLAVIDEQHRFGVAQRAALQAKGDGGEPHQLALTATPIPRTLALAFYSDMAISTLRQLPPGRQPIRTEIRDRSALPKIEAFLRSEVEGGRQVFVVVPLIAESTSLDAASAEAEAARLTSALPGLRIGLLHGQIAPDARDREMARFAAGDLDIVVATTVVEVGIDIPNASVMLIEDAERFGLAQLHQLRGRVGRGPHRSYCILLSDAGDPLARRRLETIAGSSDGFAIAEADLSLRGAGNLLGTRQAGLPPLRVASLFEPRHLALAERARELATVLVREDSTLTDRPDLRRELDALTVADDPGNGG
jgi:ATP-dependent DNA helicase RecG